MCLDFDPKYIVNVNLVRTRLVVWKLELNSSIKWYYLYETNLKHAKGKVLRGWVYSKSSEKLNWEKFCLKNVEGSRIRMDDNVKIVYS